MKISNKVESMQLSPIRKFNPIAKRAEESGKKIYKLNIGQPDVETPKCFMDAIKNFDETVIAYAESAGIEPLREAVSDYFKQYNINYTRDDMIITNGGSEAITMAMMTLLNEGDEILIPEPYYTNYNTFSKAAEGKIVPITTRAEDGYKYAKKELIEPLITDKTKMIVCINPGNPTGNVLTFDEMKLIGEIAVEHDLIILADEVYREFAYDHREMTSFGMLPEISDRVVIIDSVSKRYSACGARIGFLATKNRKILDEAMKLAQGRLCVSTVDQVGSSALFRLPLSYYDEVKSIYCKRRDVAYEEIKKIPDVVCEKPGGSFYMTVKLPVGSVEDFLVYMLEEFDDEGETTMFTPAEGFYATKGLGKDEMRIAYVLNDKDMRRAVELIRLGLESYKKSKHN